MALGIKFKKNPYFIFFCKHGKHIFQKSIKKCIIIQEIINDMKKKQNTITEKRDKK